MELWSLEPLALGLETTVKVKRRAWDLEMKLRSLEPLWPTVKVKRGALDLEMELRCLGLLAYCKGETEGLRPGNGAL